MEPLIPYSGLRDDLFNPSRRGEFFSSGQPMSESLLCAEMSRLAYARVEPDFGFDKERIAVALGSIGFTDPLFFESMSTRRCEGVHAFLAVRKVDGLGVVAFRGTDAEDISDIAYDVDFELSPWETGGRVHLGFAHALNVLLPTLGPALDSMAAHRLLFTGHSLGAAMATLLAHVRRPDALYTIGSPAVGDAAFVAALQGVTSFRYVDCADLVTRVPPSALGFVQLGKPHYINRMRQIISAPSALSMWYDTFCANSEYLAEHAWKLGNVALRALADHAPINYVWALAGDAQSK